MKLDQYLKQRKLDLAKDAEGVVEDAMGIFCLRSIASAPKDGQFVLLVGPSGYSSTPWRVEMGRWSDYKSAWVNHANDRFTDGGEAPTHWAIAPWMFDQ